MALCFILVEIPPAFENGNMSLVHAERLIVQRFVRGTTTDGPRTVAELRNSPASVG